MLSAAEAKQKTPSIPLFLEEYISKRVEIGTQYGYQRIGISLKTDWDRDGITYRPLEKEHVQKAVLHWLENHGYVCLFKEGVLFISWEQAEEQTA